MADAAKKACRLWEVPATDILRRTTEAIAAHLGVAPSGIPHGVHKALLSEDYFRRIEAIDFTIKQDDGAMPQNLNLADIVADIVLQAIRKERAKTLGFHGGMRSNYSEMDHVKSELEFAHKSFAPIMACY